MIRYRRAASVILSPVYFLCPSKRRTFFASDCILLVGIPEGRKNMSRAQKDRTKLGSGLAILRNKVFSRYLPRI